VEELAIQSPQTCCPVEHFKPSIFEPCTLRGLLVNSPTELDVILRAISFATREHEGQYRKDGKTPYVAHPLRVFSIASQLFGVTDSETLAAAVLHDTLEDTLADRDDLIEHFGPRVAEFVALLSKDKRLPEEEREASYLDALRDCPLEVKLLKLADLYDNLIDSSGLPSELRRKKITKANQVLEMYDEDFPPSWQHVLGALRVQVQRAQRAGS
jgi:(p)ppGpp synthase/HD superfamily hydrolase